MIDLGPLGLYEDIDDARPRARDSCTSYATENTDYLTVTAEHGPEFSRLRRAFGFGDSVCPTAALLLPSTAYYCPLLPITALYYLLLPITALYCLLLPYYCLTTTYYYFTILLFLLLLLYIYYIIYSYFYYYLYTIILLLLYLLIY